MLDVEIRKIRVSEIAPNDYNFQKMKPKQFDALKKHIESVGFCDPIKIRENPDGEKPFVIVDGEHRFKAFQEVFPDVEEIPCAVMRTYNNAPISRKEAIVSSIAFNKLHGEPIDIKLGMAIQMAKSGGMVEDNIADLTAMTKHKIETLLEIAESPLPANDEMPIPKDFGGSQPLDDDDSGQPEHLTFAIKPSQRAIVEKAIAFIKKTLPPEIDEGESRGECLVEMARRVTGQAT